jgi:hypothetical protein
MRLARDRLLKHHSRVTGNPASHLKSEASLASTVYHPSYRPLRLSSSINPASPVEWPLQLVHPNPQPLPIFIVLVHDPSGVCAMPLLQGRAITSFRAVISFLASLLHDTFDLPFGVLDVCVDGPHRRFAGTRHIGQILVHDDGHDRISDVLLGVALKRPLKGVSELIIISCGRSLTLSASIDLILSFKTLFSRSRAFNSSMSCGPVNPQ